MPLAEALQHSLVVRPGDCRLEHERTLCRHLLDHADAAQAHADAHAITVRCGAAGHCWIPFARQFQALRHCVCSSNYSVIESLSSSRPYAAQGGKSKAEFARTCDDTLILKEVSATEGSTFLRIASSYFAYQSDRIFRRKPSALVPILGLFEVHSTLTDTVKLFVLMPNLFDRNSINSSAGGTHFRHVFDLKGKQNGRYIHKTHSRQPRQQSPPNPSSSLSSVNASVAAAAAVTASTAVKGPAQGAKAHTGANSAVDGVAASLMSRHRHLNLERSRSSIILRLNADDDISRKNTAVMHVHDIIAGANEMLVAAEQMEQAAPEHHKAPRPADEQVLLDENFAVYTQGEPLPLLEADDAILRQAFENDSQLLGDLGIMDYSILIGIQNEHRPYQIRLGIIDYIREFTLDKKVESTIKTFLEWSAPTILPPQEYRERFLRGMRRHFIAAPNREVFADCMPGQSALDLDPDQDCLDAENRRQRVAASRAKVASSVAAKRRSQLLRQQHRVKQN